MRPRPEALTTSRTLRCPLFAGDTAVRFKVDELESYLLLCAFTQGELASARQAAYDELRELDVQWRELDGVPSSRRSTKAERELAKQAVRPDLGELRAELEEEIARLDDEYARLEADATKVSRAHTFITGR